MADVKTLMDKLALVARNPSAIQRIQLDLVEGIENGTIDIVDPSQPFVLATESSAVTAAATISFHEALLRKMYVQMVQNDEDIYRHMSDRDYIGRFASPATVPFTLLVGYEEFKRLAVSTGQGAVRKLVIPRNTQFVVDDIYFSLQYPIELRIMSHGGIQCVYDVSKPSPLQTLTSNVVPFEEIVMNIPTRPRYLRLTFPVTQFRLQTYYTKIGSAAGMSISYALTDYFYYCRIFSLDTEGNRDVEFITTHSDQVYDPNVPTAALRVGEDGKRLYIYIPEIYKTKGFLSGSVRIDIYTTRGPINLNLSTYRPTAYMAEWRDEDKDDDGIYTSPFNTFEDLSILCDRTVDGGAGPIDFPTLKKRVQNNANYTDIPITEAQMQTKLELRGYSLLKSLDNITKRIYLACRNLPVANTSQYLDGAGCLIKTLEISGSDLVTRSFVADHGDRITILPQSMFELVDGRLTMLSSIEASEIAGLSQDLLVTTFNNRQFLYTPFHYVFDAYGDAFEARGYYLDNPVMHDPYFIQENDTALLEVATGQYAIKKVSNGYEITIITRSGETYQNLPDEDVHVQLAFIPNGESERCYLNGELIGLDGKERIFRFVLETTYDLDSNDELLINNFSMYVVEPRPFPFPLDGSMDVLYSVSNYTIDGFERNNIDVILGKQLLPADVIGVLHDQINLTIGHSLNGLWHNSRTVVGSEKYARWEVDVPDVWEEDQYQLDENGNKILTVGDDGKIHFSLIHAKGTPKLDNDGNPVIKHRIGDVKRDAEGNLIVVATRDTVRQVDLFLVDGVYMATTDVNDLAYIEEIPQAIVRYLEDDIKILSENLLENTELYFYPKTTIGKINVLVDNHIETQIDSTLSFQIRYYLTQSAYNNSELRTAIHATTRTVIYEALQQTTISISDITSRLEAVLGDDVMALDVGKMGESRDVSVYTLVDDSLGCTVKKKLVVLPEGVLQVQDAIDVEFIRHQI